MRGQLGGEDTEGCMDTLTVLKHTESKNFIYFTHIHNVHYRNTNMIID